MDSFHFYFPCCSLNSQNGKQNSLIMDLMRKVYLAQQEMLKFMKKKRQDSLLPNLLKYYEARQEINDWLEKNDLPEDTESDTSQQLSDSVPKTMQNHAKSRKITDLETEGSFRRHQLERQWTVSSGWIYHTQFQHCRFSK